MPNYNAYYPVSHYYNPAQNTTAYPSYGNYGVQAPPVSQQVPPNILWVNNDHEAENYPVAPNTAVALWNTSDPVVYLKQADATGKPSIKIFDLVERESGTPQSVSQNEYAKQSDLTLLANNLKENNDHVATLMADMTDTLEKMKADIESMKGDMYGIAGKKRAAKKVEAEDG